MPQANSAIRRIFTRLFLGIRLKCSAVCNLKQKATLLPPNLRKSGLCPHFFVKKQTAFHLIVPIFTIKAKFATQMMREISGCTIKKAIAWWESNDLFQSG
jgi:hypothetical protein